jgi:uncharacterized phiE125 gp8 family phage protein
VYSHHHHAPRRASYLITAPTDAVVTLAEAKAQLRITDTSQDTFIQSIIYAAVNQLDPAAGGWLDRALRTQIWELRLDGFRQTEIKLPFPPLIGTPTVKYDDLGGTEHSLTLTTDFRILGDGRLSMQHLRPPFLGSWPVARCDVESVRIRYTCGYALTPTDAMPQAIKQAVLLMTKSFYDLGKRDALVTQDTVIGVSSKSFSVTDEAAGGDAPRRRKPAGPLPRDELMGDHVKHPTALWQSVVITSTQSWTVPSNVNLILATLVGGGAGGGGGHATGGAGWWRRRHDAAGPAPSGNSWRDANRNGRCERHWRHHW